VERADSAAPDRAPGWLSLLLPVLFPSWRFFDAIGPALRVEYALVDGAELAGARWREYRPRPARRSLAAILGGLCFDPVGNERLFALACAERIAGGERGFPEREIRARVARSLRGEAAARGAARLAFRVRRCARDGDAVRSEVVFTSELAPLASSGAAG
jgi:hypothetical protein